MFNNYSQQINQINNNKTEFKAYKEGEGGEKITNSTF